MNIKKICMQATW